MTTNPIPLTYTLLPWGKSDRQNPQRIHLLEHHLADVGACFEALLAQPTIRQRLARSGGLDALDQVTAARLAVFAALHDIGKASVSFQTQVWRDEDFPQGRRPAAFRGASHTLDLPPILKGDDEQTAEWFFNALGWWDDFLTWDAGEGESACGLFVAALSHHGSPLNLEGRRRANPSPWQPFNRLDGLNPPLWVERIGRLVRHWFPAAFTDRAPTLPSASAFQHHFLGLCTLADWIGSNEQFFPYQTQPDDNYIETARERAKRAISAIGLDLTEQRTAVSALPPRWLDFAKLFNISGAPPPNAIQRQAAQDTPLTEQLVIIESETGSGKTEAALWRFARMYEQGLVDGLYFALPTRAAASQMHRRVAEFVKRLFPDNSAPEPVLAVPGYLRSGDATGQLLQNYQVWWDDHADDGIRWAAENAKRYLAAQIAVGTVDQAMLATLQVRHAHMRAACLSRNLLVVDEVHASDPYMRQILTALLRAHRDAGGYALLMSATLGSVARRRWLAPSRQPERDNLPLAAAIASPYPAVSVPSATTEIAETIAAAGGNDQAKTVRIEALPAMADFRQVAERALSAARAGAQVLIIRNTVGYAVETQQAVEAAAAPGERQLQFVVNDLLTLHTGRFAPTDRRRLDTAVERRLGKDRPGGGGIVVGTQTLEQSLDIDADLLITDLCPVDVLLQRIGRLHRHRRADRPDVYAAPTCIVLTPPGDDLSPYLTRRQDANGLGPQGYVYQDLRIIEATRRLLARYPEWRIPELNRTLVEQATHPDALEEITQELGEDWQIHALNIAGIELADGLTARNAIIRRDKTFFGDDNREVVFPNHNEERIRTRLGDEGLAIAFAPAPPSLFDAARPVDRLDLPLRWLSRSDLPDAPVAPERIEDGFDFQVGARRFRYDRLGLRRV